MITADKFQLNCNYALKSHYLTPIEAHIHIVLIAYSSLDPLILQIPVSTTNFTQSIRHIRTILSNIFTIIEERQCDHLNRYII